MRFLKSKFYKFIIGIIGFYIFLFFMLMSDNNRSDKAYYFFFFSFVLIVGGILGLKNKVDAFKRPPQVPVVNYKISYAGDNDINGLMGRLGNVLAIIIGIIMLSGSFSL